MISEKLLGDLLKLNRAEKLRIMQLLINDLSAEEIASESLLDEGDEDDRWSPLLAIFEGSEPYHELGSD